MSLRSRRVASGFRSRACRELVRNMAAVVGVSTLLFLCGNVLNVNLVLTGPIEANMAIEDLGENRAEDLVSIPARPSLVEPGVVVESVEESNTELSYGVQRHNRVLQYMDTKKYKDAISAQDRLSSKYDVPSINTDVKFGVFTGKITATMHQDEEIDDNLRKISSLALDESIVQDVQDSDALPPGDKKAHSWSSESKSKAQDKVVAKKAFRLARNKNRSAHYRNSSEVPVKRLPKALVIGVKKSGTRALLEFLRLHPNVEGPGPEPHFFDQNYEKGLEWYRELMPWTYGDQLTVEKTPGYFITKDVPRRVRHMNATIKLILVVRDPVTRAISDYCQAASKRAVRPFEEMALLDSSMGLVNTSWSAIKVGMYAKHMERWLQVFPLSQFHLVDGQKLISEPAKELAKVEQFLGLPKFINETHFYLNVLKGSFPCMNRAGRPHCLDQRTKGRKHPNVREDVLQRLREFYKPFNAKFYQMVGTDFGWS